MTRPTAPLPGTRLSWCAKGMATSNTEGPRNTLEQVWRSRLKGLWVGTRTQEWEPCPQQIPKSLSCHAVTLGHAWCFKSKRGPSGLVGMVKTTFDCCTAQLKWSPQLGIKQDECSLSRFLLTVNMQYCKKKKNKYKKKRKESPMKWHKEESIYIYQKKPSIWVS